MKLTTAQWHYSDLWYQILFRLVKKYWKHGYKSIYALKQITTSTSQFSRYSHDQELFMMNLYTKLKKKTLNGLTIYIKSQMDVVSYSVFYFIVSA